MSPTSIRFLHPVGKSTLSQGLTVPISAQVGWIARIQKGQSVSVTILFGQHEQVTAQLRRLNNALGHLQFRYESHRQSPFKEYLTSVFGTQPSQRSAVLEITEVGDKLFSFVPIAGQPTGNPVLSLYKPHFHSVEPVTTPHDLPELSELEQTLRSVAYDGSCTQRDYNSRIGQLLTEAGWRSEPRIVDGIGLRCDFEKHGVWLEIEFGNARTYYQDYVKFLLAGQYQAARCGILICPTSAFADLLCELGRKRAAAKRQLAPGVLPSYSGMMSYEKAIREFPYIQFMLTKSVVIAGIDIISDPGLACRTRLQC